MNILILKNSLGRGFGGPAEDLENFLLLDAQNTVVTVSHPLNKQSEQISELWFYDQGRLIRRITITRKKFSVISFLWDFYYTRRLLKNVKLEFDYVFAFNLLTTAQVLSKRICESPVLISWYVDFVPFKTRGFFKYPLIILNLFVSKKISARIENNSKAAQERAKFDSNKSIFKSYIVPIGVPKKSFCERTSALSRPAKMVFLGTLNSRNGIDKLLDILIELGKMDFSFKLDVIGTGEMFNKLNQHVVDFDLSQKVKIHGYLPDGPEIDNLLFNASVGLAPYSNEVDGFTQFADPLKIKRYMAAGLAVIMSDVPATSALMTQFGGAVCLPSSASASNWAREICRILSDEAELKIRQSQASDYSVNFQNEIILDQLFKQLQKDFSS
jgi:glycosyltransferase involved in cell wall biosynthesis